MSPAFGVGLIKGWSMLWTAVLLVVQDIKTDFRRIERSNTPIKRRNHSQTFQASATTTSQDQDHQGRVRKRDIPVAEGLERIPNEDTAERNLSKSTLFWEAYPDSLLRRIDWVADAFTTFRGMTWSWRISGPPPVPESIQLELQDGFARASEGGPRYVVGRDGTRMYSNLRDLLVARARSFVVGYLVTDALKTITVHDEYFLLGDHGKSAPSFIPLTFQNIPGLVQSYRLVVSMMMIYTGLHIIFDLAPLFFAGLLGPKLIGVRGEPWVYPDTYGSFTKVLDKGLGGFWGGWWHQTFRYGFESIGKRATRELKLHPRSASAKMLQLVVAFGLSGCLHACGSMTQPGSTYPLRGPFLFFILQPCGIILQPLLSNQLKRLGILEKMPKFFRRATNFMYAYSWLHFTAPLLVDDFARGGLWLFEPIPFSPLRGLGLGVEDMGWWCWEGFPWIRWHRGKHWWQTGLAL
ncbi:MAG: hypothetical protein M1820_000033 [Bogoriella megaspora]|nr:MAG: hypothetical protein M1820_000033 [Bogoriella megaspora]